jgi:serine/threonine-protein kinase RsbW
LQNHRSDTSKLLLTIVNHVPEIRRMSIWIDAASRQLGLPAGWISKFDLCANEAVANIISYAFPDDGMHEISLRLSFNGSSASLDIEDDGIPFNPLDVPEYVQPASLEEAPIGGLGIVMIRRNMDECKYIRRNGKNVLKMTVVASRPRDLDS